MMIPMTDQELKERLEKLKNEFNPGTIFTSQYLTSSGSKTYCRMIVSVDRYKPNPVFTFIQLENEYEYYRIDYAVMEDLGCVNIISQPKEL